MPEATDPPGGTKIVLLSHRREANCDKFVLSVAHLLYWRRKREHWQLLAEGAPDDYLHRLDRAWRGAYGTLVCYADDVLVMCDPKDRRRPRWRG